VNALIVDDERLARNELRRLLTAHADVTIVGEASNGDEAEARLAAADVDVLFLDIQMPGANGFELLERLDRVPLVIFTTAYDEYAVRAFEVNAFDDLLKPSRPERLSVALEKARVAWSALRAEKAGPQKRTWSDRVFLRDGERCWLVALADIELFEADGNYTRAFFKAERPMIRTALQSLEQKLDPAVFFRASRRHVINLRHVEAIDDGVDDSYTVRLRSGRTVTVSRRQSRRLRETLSL
jgi:two-component system LytT family response regulator